MTIRVALIGAGGIGTAHSSAYEQISNARVTAVVDVHDERARKIGLLHDAHSYTSVDKMLANETVQMVDICTPTFTHKELAVQCANHGLHVMAEKPIAYTLEDARSMLDAARTNNILFMVAQVLRFWPEYIYLKQVYDQGTYGCLIQLWFSRVCGAPALDWEGWFADSRRSGLAPFELHIHDLDFIYYLLGKPLAVSSVGIDRPEIRASYLKTSYQYKELPGVVVEAEGGWWQGPVPFAASFRAVFEKATIIYDHEQMTIFEGGSSEPRKVDFVNGLPVSEKLDLKNTNAIYNEIAYFVECVRTNTLPTAITPDQSYAVLEILNAELQSAQCGQTVVL
jgi:predicted dehydrogenase